MLYEKIKSLEGWVARVARNKTMKKITIVLILALALTLPVAALAAIDPYTPPEGNASIGDLEGLVESILRIMWVVFGAIAVIMFVTAGILFLTAMGAPEKVQAARSAFIWGIVGVVVGIIAYSILYIIGSALGV